MALSDSSLRGRQSRSQWRRDRERHHVGAGLRCGLQNHRIGPDFWWLRRLTSPKARRRDGAALTPPPRKDCGVTEAKGLPNELDQSAAAEVARLENY